MEFNLGWFADPIYFGDYPPAMRAQLGARLPTFSAEQRAMLTNSSDFFALQHYASMMISSRPENEALADGTFHKDENVKWHNTAGARKNMLGWDIAPFGLYKLAKWVHRRYSPPAGSSSPRTASARRGGVGGRAPRQPPRLLCQALPPAAQRAMDEGVAVRRPRRAAPPSPTPTRPPPPPLLGARYFYWSFIDNFEWAEGTRARFGLVYIDYATQRRVAKTSAAFFARLAQTNSFRSPSGATPRRRSPRASGGSGELTKLMSSSTARAPRAPTPRRATARPGRTRPGRPRRRARADDDEAEGGAGDADGAVRCSPRCRGATTPSRASSS